MRPTPTRDYGWGKILYKRELFASTYFPFYPANPAYVGFDTSIERGHFYGACNKPDVKTLNRIMGAY